MDVCVALRWPLIEVNTFSLIPNQYSTFDSNDPLFKSGNCLNMSFCKLCSVVKSGFQKDGNFLKDSIASFVRPLLFSSLINLTLRTTIFLTIRPISSSVSLPKFRGFELLYR